MGAGLLPYFVLTGGVVVLLTVVSLRRGHGIAFVTAVVSLAATGLALVFGPVLAPGGGDYGLAADLMVLDGYADFFNGLFVVAALVTAVLARAYLSGRAGEVEEFYILLVTATLGAMVMSGAGHFATLLLGLEILSVSLYVLIAYVEEGHPPLEAGLKYLVLSGVASTTLLFGAALIYTATGALAFGELAAVPVQPGFEVHMLVGQGLVVAGLAFKLSLVPFHMWTPDVYQGAPAPVAGFLATVSKGAVFALALRYVRDTGVLASAGVSAAVVLFAVLSMVIGNLLALLQDDVKRMLAYSSIGHVGYLLICLVAVTTLADVETAVEAGMVYLAGYFIMTLAAFGVISVLSGARKDADTASIDAYQGLFWRRPLAATVLSVALLSLAGIPLTVGFVAKFYLLATGVEGRMWLLVWALIAGSAVAIYYYLRVIIAMTRAAPDVADEGPAGANLAGRSVLVVLGVTVVLLGIYPTPLIDVVRVVLGVTG